MIGSIIQQKRKEAGMTQAQLAEYLGVTAPAVNRWEKDLSFPDATLLAPLARCLKTDLNELFSFYDSLSDKERELISDKVMKLFLEEDDEKALKYIEDVLRQNLSDGKLYLQMAKTLYGMHLLKKVNQPDIYLEQIIQYYERALELLPEEEQNISENLMTIYAYAGNGEKAKEYWSRRKGKRLDLLESHANMLFMLKNYPDAAEEVKELVLHKVVDLSTNLGMLHDILVGCGEEDLAQVAVEKAAGVRKLFELWDGFEIINLVASAVSTMDAEAHVKYMKDFVQLDPSGEQITTSPLFAGIKLGSAEGKESTIADRMADLMVSLNKLQ